MKANIEIKFIKIGKTEISKEVVEKETKLLGVTQKAVNELCRTIEKYFRKKKIIVIADSNVVNN